MKKSNLKYIMAVGLLSTGILLYSCNKFLNKAPVGSLVPSVVATKAGVEGLLIGAYAMLKGWNTQYTQLPDPYATGLDNSPFGGYASDDAYKGSNTTDQGPDAPAVENHSINSAIGYLQQKFDADYNGIQRANDAIREIPLVTDGSLSATDAAEVVAEARFLRGVFHFDLAKVFRNVPFINETIYYGSSVPIPANPGPIWDSIENDFTAAMAVLPKTQTDIGRCNYYAAEAFLAKAYMFDHQYATALPLLTDVITNGVNTQNKPFALGPYENNFNAATRNNTESVFCIQATVNDGSGGQNSNPGDILNFPGGGTYTNCCGFYQPSYTLANAFKVDANGLPMFQMDAATGFPTYNDVDLPNDHGLGAADPFTPPANALDPRLDWTMGRRGIPYLDWGICGGETWTRGDLVPYNPIKNVFWEGNVGSTAENSVWGATDQGTAINYNLIRLADVYLWRAECYVEANQLDQAQADVNTVRGRMANNHSYWVHQYLNNATPLGGSYTDDAHLAANYVIGLYGTVPSTGFTVNGQEYAREAVYMERQLEFGMEGHRFFDLQRYDGIFGGPEPTGYMATIQNAHIKADCRAPHPNAVLTGATFTQNRNELFPIPQHEIDLAAGKLTQNKGY